MLLFFFKKIEMEKFKSNNNYKIRQELENQPQQSKPKTIDIDSLHSFVFDVNAKLDSNIYWLMTLLENVILSIETLNTKALSLDKRLTTIENTKNNNNVNNDLKEFRNDLEKFKINIPTKLDELNAKIDSINDVDRTFSSSSNLNEEIENEVVERNVVLRRRTTVQVIIKKKFILKNFYNYKNKLDCK